MAESTGHPQPMGTRGSSQSKGHPSVHGHLWQESEQGAPSVDGHPWQHGQRWLTENLFPLESSLYRPKIKCSPLAFGLARSVASHSLAPFPLRFRALASGDVSLRCIRSGGAWLSDRHATEDPRRGTRNECLFYSCPCFLSSHRQAELRLAAKCY